MLTNQENIFRPFDSQDFYLSQVGVESEVINDELAAARKRKEMKHLRQIQTVNVLERAAIRVVELFQNKRRAG